MVTSDNTIENKKSTEHDKSLITVDKCGSKIKIREAVILSDVSDGWCKLKHKTSGFSINFPIDWEPGVVGAWAQSITLKYMDESVITIYPKKVDVVSDKLYESTYDYHGQTKRVISNKGQNVVIKFEDKILINSYPSEKVMDDKNTYYLILRDGSNEPPKTESSYTSNTIYVLYFDNKFLENKSIKRIINSFEYL